MVSFVKENGGYERARQKFIQQTSDVGDAGDLYSVIAKNVEQFLESLSHPKIPTEYNELMKHIWDNPHLVLSVASYVFDIPPPYKDENVARELQFGGRRKKRTSRNKGKKTSNKKTLKRRITKSK